LAGGGQTTETQTRRPAAEPDG